MLGLDQQKDKKFFFLGVTHVQRAIRMWSSQLILCGVIIPTLLPPHPASPRKKTKPKPTQAHMHARTLSQKLKEDKCCTWVLGLAFWLTVLVWKLSKSAWPRGADPQIQWDKQGPGKERKRMVIAIQMSAASTGFRVFFKMGVPPWQILPALQGFPQARRWCPTGLCKQPSCLAVHPPCCWSVPETLSAFSDNSRIWAKAVSLFTGRFANSKGT